MLCLLYANSFGLRRITEGFEGTDRALCKTGHYIVCVLLCVCRQGDGRRRRERDQVRKNKHSRSARKEWVTTVGTMSTNLKADVTELGSLMDSSNPNLDRCKELVKNLKVTTQAKRITDKFLSPTLPYTDPLLTHEKKKKLVPTSMLKILLTNLCACSSIPPQHEMNYPSHKMHSTSPTTRIDRVGEVTDDESRSGPRRIRRRVSCFYSKNKNNQKTQRLPTKFPFRFHFSSLSSSKNRPLIHSKQSFLHAGVNSVHSSLLLAREVYERAAGLSILCEVRQTSQHSIPKRKKKNHTHTSTFMPISPLSSTSSTSYVNESTNECPCAYVSSNLLSLCCFFYLRPFPPSYLAHQDIPSFYRNVALLKDFYFDYA